MGRGRGADVAKLSEEKSYLYRIYTLFFFFKFQSRSNVNCCIMKRSGIFLYRRGNEISLVFFSINFLSGNPFMIKHHISNILFSLKFSSNEH